MGTGSRHILASPDFFQWRQYSGPWIGAGYGGGLPKISRSRPTPAPHTVRQSQDKILGVSVREFLNWLNGGMRMPTHCGQHQPTD